MMDILIGGTVDRAVPQHAEAKDHADLGIKSWSVSLARAANDYARSPPAPAAPRARQQQQRCIMHIRAAHARASRDTDTAVRVF